MLSFFICLQVRTLNVIQTPVWVKALVPQIALVITSVYVILPTSAGIVNTSLKLQMVSTADMHC